MHALPLSSGSHLLPPKPSNVHVGEGCATSLSFYAGMHTAIGTCTTNVRTLVPRQNLH